MQNDISYLLSLIKVRNYEGVIGLLRMLQSLTREGHDPLETLIQQATRTCQSLIECRSKQESHRTALEDATAQEHQLNEKLTRLLDQIETVSSIRIVRELPTAEKIEPLPFSQQPHKPGANGTSANGNGKTAAHPKKQDQLTAYCLGDFQVYRGSMPINNWQSRKARLLFQYFLLHRDQRIHKERLMDLFWPNTPQEAARNNLNVTVYGLRQTLGKPEGGSSLIVFEHDYYRLNPEIDIWVDYEAFLESFNHAHELLRGQQKQDAHIRFVEAEQLYQGSLFMGETDTEWSGALRERLQTTYLNILAYLANAHLEVRDYAACIAVCHRILAIDECDETTHQLLMRCYGRQGQANLARRQYHQCARALNQQLSLTPSEETTRLYERICTGEAD